LSDLLYVIVYYVIGYRKKVVKSNLDLTLGHLSKAEHKSITKGFYRHLCDLFIELIKLLSVSKQDILERFKIRNPEVIKDLEAKNKSIIFLYAHYATFEYSAAFTLYNISYKGYGVYKRIRNKAFDRLINTIRSRFGVVMIDKNGVPKTMMLNQAKNQKSIYGMIADQSPKAKNIKHWTNFLGIETPVFVGAEVLAKRLDLSVCYMKIEKVKRGYYEVDLIPITTNAKAHKDFEITDTYFKLLEKQVISKPEYYFWSHKRWKHRKGN